VIPVFNPAAETAGDMNYVAKAREDQELRRERTVRVSLAVNEHGLILIGE
jgi:hypothetical protein